MGLFNRLFKADPTKDLTRAEKLLARGDALEAMRLVERAQQNGAGPAAGALATRAREALVTNALENVARAKESEYWADAAEWLERVLPHVDDARREQFETLIAEFTRLEQEANQPEIPAAFTADEAQADGPPDLDDSDNLYEIYLESLRDEVAAHFSNRSDRFHHAVVRLNEGDFEAALEILEELATAEPHDPVLHLERGRARLAHGQFEDAATDLEIAWEEFGPEPLDHAGHLSIPALWGETQLALENSSGLVERLGDLANPRSHDTETLKVYAQALLAEKDFEKASRFLAEAWNHHPKVHDFPFMLAHAGHALGRTADAIATLEDVVAPSCGPAGCNVGALHLPSMVALINLHLEGGDPERARELLELLTGMRGGRLGRDELLLMAKYYDTVGNEPAAREARERADQAASAPATLSAPRPRSSGMNAILGSSPGAFGSG